MRWGSVLVLLGTVSFTAAADLGRLPPNKWVEIKYTTQQPANPAAKGRFARQGWNKLVYDPDGKRILFYDRWVDKKHGALPSTATACSGSTRRPADFRPSGSTTGPSAIPRRAATTRSPCPRMTKIPPPVPGTFTTPSSTSPA
jgi:hypothetical protein